jgi:hypothetical protein
VTLDPRSAGCLKFNSALAFAAGIIFVVAGCSGYHA